MSFYLIGLNYVTISLLGSKRISAERNVSLAFVLVFKVFFFFNNDKHFRKTEKSFPLSCFLKKEKKKTFSFNVPSLMVRKIPVSHCNFSFSADVRDQIGMRESWCPNSVTSRTLLFLVRFSDSKLHQRDTASCANYLNDKVFLFLELKQQ